MGSALDRRVVRFGPPNEIKLRKAYCRAVPCRAPQFLPHRLVDRSDFADRGAGVELGHRSSRDRNGFEATVRQAARTPSSWR
eukprot:SAG31_NODE_46_length_30980_cov_226.095107_2_plen_82_part_00